MTTRLGIAVGAADDNRNVATHLRRPLSRRECLQKLRGGTVARLAVTAGALPHIAVVGYSMVGGILCLDLGSGTDADKIAGSVVAFERGADGPGPAWSVCAVGVAVRGGAASRDEATLQLDPELLSGWTAPGGDVAARPQQ
jgi:hypothetical protein